MIGCICVCIFVSMSQNGVCLASSRSKNSQKKRSWCFPFALGCLDVVNKMADCRFTSYRALVLFLCSYLRAPLESWGLEVVRHVAGCSYMCNASSSCMIYTAPSDYSGVHAQCIQGTMYVFYGTLVYFM